MNRPIDKNTLGYLGPDFQYKLVKHFMEEPGFFPGLYSVVEQNTFTELLLRQFVGVLKDYYSNTSLVPSYETMAMLLKQKARMENELEEWDELIKNLKELSPEGCEVIEETATKFFRQQNMIKVANDILKKTQDGDTDHYDECMKMMEDALTAGAEEDLGFNPYDVIDEVMRPNSETPIPTGISYIDDKLNGGLYKGHLGLVVGPTGFGKTTISTAMASFASTYRCDLNQGHGWKMLQICFEDDVRAMAKKHYSRITQIEAAEITKLCNIEQARELLDEFEGKELFKENLIVKKFKTHTKSVDDIKIFIKRLINKGFKPDGIILDYFECLKLIRRDRSETKWDCEENAMRQLEVLAEEFNVALWVMSQGNRNSIGAEIVTNDHVSGSIAKAQIAHVTLSIARGLEDIQNCIATMVLNKNRQGPSGQVFKDIKFNNGTCTISCDEVEVFDDKKSYEAAYAEQEQANKNHALKVILDSQRKRANEEVTTTASEPIIEEQTSEEEDNENIEDKTAEAPAPAANTDFEKEEPTPEPVVVRKPVAPGEFKLIIDKPVTVTSPKEEIEDINEDLAIQDDEWASGVIK